MRISTDVIQTLDNNGVDVSSAWLWVDADSYDGSYRQILDQPISLEAITMDFLRWKVSPISITIRESNDPGSNVLFAGQADLISDDQLVPAPATQTIYPSTGIIGSIPSIIDNGNGTVTVGPCTVALRDDVTAYENPIPYGVSSATFTIPADSQTYYVCARYSNGTAAYYLEVLEGNINARTITPVYACWNILGVVSSQYFGTNGDLLANKIDYAQVDTVPYRRSIAGGLTISESNLVWSATAAVVYAGTTPLQISAITASTSNLIKAYHVGGAWTYSAGSATYDNTNYDNGVALAALGNNKYGVRWIFRSVSNPAQLVYVLGTSYYSNYNAAASELMRTDLPELVSKHCILIGKAIVQSGAAAGETLSTFDVSFAGGAISSDHNALGGIYGDSPFYHLSQPAYTEINNITALSGTGLLKLTSGTPSIDSTSYWSSSNHPTALYNYGITSSDPTLDGRYLQLIGGILTGSLFGVNSYLNANENTHDTAPVLTLTNSIYTLGTTLLLAAGPGSTSEIGFSNIGKPAGNQRWNIGVYNDIFYIGGNPTNATGNLNPYTFSRSGNLGVYGSVTAASFNGPLSGNASTATRLAAARTIALSGDGTWSVSFDGSANVSGSLTLASLLTAGSAGSSTSVPTLTWDAKGRLTAVGSAAISIPHTQISDWSTTLSNYDMLSSTTFSVPVTGDGIITLATGSRIEGTYDIRWEGNSRVEHLQVVVSTTQYGSNYLGINCYKTYGASNSFQRISIYQNSDASIKYLCLTIGNRNSSTGSLAIKYFGAYGPSSGGTYTGSEVAYLLPTLNTYQNTGAISSPTIYEGGTALSSKYLLSSAAASKYLPLSGGTLTGDAVIFSSGAAAGGFITQYNNTSYPTELQVAGLMSGSVVFGYGSSVGSYSIYGDMTYIGTGSGGSVALSLPLSVSGAVSAPSFTEGGTALSSKYLGISASIPHTRISDWSTYINQALTTTSSPTFGNASLGTWATNPGVAWFGAAGQNNSTNGNSGFLQFVTGDKSVFMCAPTGGYANIQCGNIQYIAVGASGVSMPNSTGLTVAGPITANGGITGYLKSSDAASTYASLTSSNSFRNTNVFVDILASSGGLAVNGYVTLTKTMYSVDSARTLSTILYNTFIYNVGQTTTQTLPNGSYDSQAIIIKNNASAATITLSGSFGTTSSSTISAKSTSVLVWNASDSKWY